MTNIIHRRDPAGIVAPTVYSVPKNTNILEWLSSTFDSQNDLCGDLACSFFLNEKEIFRNDHKEVNNALLDITLGEHDQLIIINRPAAIGTVLAIISIVIAVASAAYAYMNQPELPGAEEAGNESPNNRLNGASNAFRPGMGIPECFGFGVSYPDFIQPSFYVYENNIKKVVAVMASSAGAIDVPIVKVGDTDILDIPFSSANVFLPGTKPADKFLTIHQSAANVDGQTLVAPNDGSLVKNNIEFTIEITSGEAIITTTKEVAKDLNIEEDAYLYIRSTSTDGGGVPALNGVFLITGLNITDTVAVIVFSTSYTGPTVGISGSLGRGDGDAVVGEGTAGTLDWWIGWFDTPGEQAESQLIHWQAPQGVRTKDGGLLSLSVRFEVENIATSQRFIKDVTITDNTFDPQFITTKIESDEFPGLTIGQYKIRARRLSGVSDHNGTASEKLRLEAFVSVTPYSVADFGDVTTILVQRRATLFSPDQSGKKINLDYQRKLPFYNRVTDAYELNNLQATKSFADAVAYTLIVKGNETESSVNLAELYAIADSLSDPELGAFTFTFDDANLSKGERVEAICNVARVVSFHDGQRWRFSRDEEKPVRAAMFNRRSVTGNNAKQAWQPQRDDDADSVRVMYVDPESNTEAYIDRRFDVGTGSIISGEIGIIPIEIKLAGCRNAFQATNRAELEIRRIAYQRRVVRETTYRDALELELLDRVGWVDINDVDTFDGEIMGFDGDDYDTTERFMPEIGKSYVVFLTDSEGYPTNTVPCEPRLDTEFGFSAVGISGAYVASGNQQVGSRYFIADADDLESSNFTLKSRTPNAGNTVEIELVEYNARMYEKDNATAPQAAPILNNGLASLDVEQVGGSSLCDFTLNNDGTIGLNGKTALWYSAGQTIGIGASFEVYATIVSGSVDSGSIGVWSDISSGITWQNSRAASEGVTETVLNLQIREKANTDNSVSNNVAIRSVIADAVFLPANINIDIEAEVNQAQARIDFLSNGELRGNDGDAGYYTTVVDLIGEYYEIKATNLVGELDLGVVNEWLPLGGAGATFILTATATESVSFDVEVREVANVANNATSAVNLSVVVA